MNKLIHFNLLFYFFAFNWIVLDAEKTNYAFFTPAAEGVDDGQAYRDKNEENMEMYKAKQKNDKKKGGENSLNYELAKLFDQIEKMKEEIVQLEEEVEKHGKLKLGERMKKRATEIMRELTVQIGNAQNKIGEMRSKLLRGIKFESSSSSNQIGQMNADADEETHSAEYIAFGMEKQKWNGRDCGPNLTVLGNGLVIKHNGPNWVDNSIRAIFPVPRFDQNAKKPYIAFYFEARIVDKEGCAGIGFSDRQFRLEDKFVGNANNSIGIRSKYGIWVDGKYIELAENFKGFFEKGDIIGIGLLYSPSNSSVKCFATYNGKFIGSVDLAPKFIDFELFPTATLYRSGESIQTNFGKEKLPFNLLQLFN